MKLERFIVAVTSILGRCMYILLILVSRYIVPTDVDRYSICIENKYAGLVVLRRLFQLMPRRDKRSKKKKKKKEEEEEEEEKKEEGIGLARGPYSSPQFLRATVKPYES